MQYFLLFLDSSLNIMPSRLAHAVAYVNIFFLYYSDSFIKQKNIPGGTLICIVILEFVHSSIGT